MVKNLSGETQQALLSLLKMEDGIRIDMVKLGELVDLYNYFPVRVKRDKNQSNDLYWQMLSNKLSLSELIQRKEPSQSMN